MMSLQNIFETILRMSLMGSFAICIAFLLRPFLIRLPRIYAYILWLVIFLRLLVPVLQESRFSLIPTTFSAVTLTDNNMKTADISADRIPTDQDPSDNINQDIDDLIPSPVSNAPAVSSVIKTDTAENHMDNKMQNSAFSINHILTIAPWIWGIGFAGLLLINLFRFLRIYRFTRQAERYEKNIYRLKEIPSSFVFGIFCPGIYISADMAESAAPYVLCHESIHIKRRDYLIKLICFFILCLHWFNPLVWIAFYLCSQDMEMSCDEQTIQKMGMQEKPGYSGALLQAATDLGPLSRPYPAFSSNEAKKRIKNVLQYKKRSTIVIGITALLLGGLSLGLLMNPFQDTYAKHLGKERAVSNSKDLKSILMEYPESENMEYLIDDYLHAPDTDEIMRVITDNEIALNARLTLIEWIPNHPVTFSEAQLQYISEICQNPQYDYILRTHLLDYMLPDSESSMDTVTALLADEDAYLVPYAMMKWAKIDLAAAAAFAYPKIVNYTSEQQVSTAVVIVRAAVNEDLFDAEKYISACKTILMDPDNLVQPRIYGTLFYLKQGVVTELSSLNSDMISIDVFETILNSNINEADKQEFIKRQFSVLESFCLHTTPSQKDTETIIRCMQYAPNPQIIDSLEEIAAGYGLDISHLTKTNV